MTLRRPILACIALAVFATACAGADPSTIRGAIEAKKQESKTAEVDAPPQPDLTRTGRIGVQLSTNSRGWQKVLGAADAAGAIIVFVNGGSPAERAGLRRGDVITHIGGSAIHSEQRARVGLRGKPGVPLRLTIARSSGSTEIDVTPGPAEDVDIAKLIDAALAKDPNDPTNLLLRAQAGDVVQDSITYVNRALAVETEFVDALVYRARLFWSESLQVTNEAVAQEDRRRAADDYRKALEIDPDATAALRSRATGSLEISAWDDAERDALRAIGIDPTLPGGYYIVAAARYAVGRIRESLAPAREAVRLDPYDAPSYRLLALAFVALDRREDAQKTVEAGLTVAVDDNQRAALRAVVEE